MNEDGAPLRYFGLVLLLLGAQPCLFAAAQDRPDPAGSDSANADLVGLESAAAKPSRAILRERRIRLWAKDPLRHAATLRTALQSDDWTEREAALDALTRGAPVPIGGEFSVHELVAEAATDPHPNVQAAAFLCAAARFVPLADSVLERALESPLPWLQSAAIGALDPRSPLNRKLKALANTSDSNLRDAARQGLLNWQVDNAMAKVRVLEHLESGSDGATRIAFFDRLALDLPDCEVLEIWRRRALGRREVAVASLIAALQIACDPSQDVLECVATGLIEPSLVEARAQDFLAGRMLLAPAEFGQELLVLLEFIDAAGRGPLAKSHPALLPHVAALRESPPTAERVRRTLLHCLVRLLGADRAARLCENSPLRPGTQRILMEELGFQLKAWRMAGGTGSGLGPDWFTRKRPLIVRLAAVQILEADLLHGKADIRRSAGSMLAQIQSAELLRSRDFADGIAGSPEEDAAAVKLFGAAFRALARAKPQLWWDELHRDWSQLDPAWQVELLQALPRTQAPTAFRADLMRMAAEPGEAALEGRVQALDLLQGFRGDVEVGNLLRSLLERELERFPRAEAGERKAADLRVAGILQAQERVLGDGAQADLLRGLRASVEKGSSFGKVPAKLLGKSALGRDRLGAFLGPEVEQRTRIEVAIVLGAEGHAQALEVLAQLAKEAAPDLVARMLAALGRGGDWMRLRDFALDRSASVHLRQAATAALEHVDAKATGAVYFELARRADDYDVRDLALRAMGRIGGAEMASKLEMLWRMAGGDPGQPEVAPEFADFASETREALAQHAFNALVHSGAMGEQLESFVLQRAGLEQDSWLEARFDGEIPAKVTFTFSDELERAGSLAVKGRLGRVLAASGNWWEWDARFLMALARVVTQAASSDKVRERGLSVDSGKGRDLRRELYHLAAELEHSARIGLAGELKPDPYLSSLALCRELMLALEGERKLHAAALAKHILAQRRIGMIPDGAWSRAFPNFDSEAAVRTWLTEIAQP